MENANVLLTKIEQARLWAYFHKDWLLQMRSLLRPQLPPEFHIFVESEAILIAPDDATRATPVLPDVSVAAEAGEIDSASRATSRATNAVIEVEEPCETFTQYTLLIRRSPENLVVAALEVLSPSNKGRGNQLDQEKHIRKRNVLLDAGVNLLEIDALTEGNDVLPTALFDLSKFDRNAWTATHFEGRRKLRGWGWNEVDPLPIITWGITESVEAMLDLPLALEQAREFNSWDEFVR